MGANTSTSPTLEATLKKEVQKNYGLISLPTFNQSGQGAGPAPKTAKAPDNNADVNAPQLITDEAGVKTFKEELDKNRHPWPKVSVKNKNTAATKDGKPAQVSEIWSLGQSVEPRFSSSTRKSRNRVGGLSFLITIFLNG